MGEIIESDRVRPRVFTLSEMFAGTAFSSSPIISGQLYAVRPELPLLSSIALSTLMIPVLLIAQRRLLPARPPHPSTEVLVATSPLVESEAA